MSLPRMMRVLTIPRLPYAIHVGLRAAMMLLLTRGSG